MFPIGFWLRISSYIRIYIQIPRRTPGFWWRIVPTNLQTCRCTNSYRTTGTSTGTVPIPDRVSIPVYIRTPYTAVYDRRPDINWYMNNVRCTIVVSTVQYVSDQGYFSPCDWQLGPRPTVPRLWYISWYHTVIYARPMLVRDFSNFSLQVTPDPQLRPKVKSCHFWSNFSPQSAIYFHIYQLQLKSAFNVFRN